MTLTVTFKLGTDLDHAQVQVQNRVSQALPRLPEDVRQLGVTTQQELARPHDGRAPRLARRAATTTLYLRNYAALQRQGRARAHPRRRRGAGVRRRRLRDARLARSAEARRARPDRRATSCARSASRTCRWPPASSARRRRRSGTDFQLSINAQGRLVDRGGVRQHHRQDRRPTAECTRLRDVARIELGAGDYALRSLLDNKPAVGDRRSSRRPGSNALAALRTTCARRWRSSSRTSRRASTTASSTTRPCFVRDSIEAVIAHAARGDRCWSCSS